MSNGLDFPLEFCEQYAARCMADLDPYTERMAIVGSVRRKRAVCHDIELLVIPILEPIIDMFGQVAGNNSRFESIYQDLLEHWGAKHLKGAEAYKKILLPEGIVLEINLSTPKRWPVEIVIKTGPAEFSHKVVTTRQRGGFLPSNCVIKDGWQVYRNTTPLEIKTEQEFLELLGLGWVDPEKR